MTHTVRVVSLNIQHGWNVDGPLPIPFRRSTVITNLNNIARLLNRYAPDIVLLQEVDRVSPLTNSIDQLRYIASRVGYLHRAHGASSELRLGKRILYAAGCGILSRFPIVTTENIKFDQSWPTLRKGFLIATVAITPGKKLTVVSAHFPPIDILNVQSKRRQIEHLAKALHDKGPIIIGGDLNMSLSRMNRNNIRVLAKRLNVRTHRAVVDERLATYPSRGPRRKIDWIFASPEILMSDYTVFPDRVSDHRAIGTTLTF